MWRRVSELGTRSLKRWGQLITHAFIHLPVTHLVLTHVLEVGIKRKEERETMTTAPAFEAVHRAGQASSANHC